MRMRQHCTEMHGLQTLTCVHTDSGACQTMTMRGWGAPLNHGVGVHKGEHLAHEVDLRRGVAAHARKLCALPEGMALYSKILTSLACHWM